MARSRVKQANPASQVASGRNRSQTNVASSGRSNRSKSSGQPAFVSQLSRKTGRSIISQKIFESDRSGDVRAEDLVPRSISEIQIKDASRTIHLTIGKYDGTNFGLAAGTDPASPDLTLDKDSLTINTSLFLKFASGSRFIMWNPANDKSFQIGYILTQFQILSTTDTNGVMLGRNVCLGDQAPDYASGARVIFIGNNQSTPSGTPSNGGVLYVTAGALRWKGSSGSDSEIGAS